MIDVRTNERNSIKVFIDNVEINGIQDEEIPAPDTILKKARLKYMIIPKDEGQLLADKAMYGDNETHEYKVVIAEDQTFIYDAVVYSHELNTEGLLTQTVYLKLNGKFRYIRNGEDKTLEIERTF